MSIETLNQWGEHFWGFAVAMLWQSSLLIVAVLAVDWVSAKRIRATVRYALWMVVLVKLLLPPTLALPTGAAWWLWPAKPALVPVMKSETITFDATTPMIIPRMAPVALPPVKLSGEGWALLVAGAMSIGLLLWLIFNWLKVAVGTRQTAAGPFDGALGEARQLAGLRQRVRLKLIGDAVSPAVFGLLRPVILLPRALAEKLSPEQLRTVLLHEVIHVRRGDVWVNCAQTLLQIFYWWHPLLWLANARIRRLREEAVDDAVMCRLNEAADAYAPTLLEVAKFAFRRPLASLGLVGILESRSALRQRIERLADFCPPRRAGLSLLSLCLIFAFSAVALPMGQSPISATDSISVGQSPSPAPASSPASVLIENRFFWMPSDAFETLTAGLPFDNKSPNEKSADAGQLNTIHQRMRAWKTKPFAISRILTGSGEEADFYSGSPTNWIKFDCTPLVTDGRIDLLFKMEVNSVFLHNTTTLIAHEHVTVVNQGGVIVRIPDPNDASSNLVLVMDVHSQTRQDVLAKLSSTHMGISYQNATLGDVLLDLTKQAGKFDPGGTRISFVYSGSLPDNVAATEPTAIHINLTLGDCSLAQILDALCAASDYPIKYSVEDDAVTFRPIDLIPAKYEMRTFKIDPSEFFSNLQRVLHITNSPPTSYITTPPPNRDISFLAKEFFKELGINLDPPKTLFFNDRLGLLFVYATPQDLDVVERAIQILTYVPPQIHIKVRFVEMPSTTAGSVVSGTGILTEEAMKKLLPLLTSQKGVRELSEPEGVTLSSRQMRMMTAETVQVVTNYAFEASDKPHVPSVVPQISNEEMGEMFDMTPMVLADGYTINLHATASRTQFFGYADTKGFTGYTTNYGDGKIQLPVVLPAVQVRSASTDANLWDGQTLVLFPNAKELVDCAPDEKTQERVTDHIRKAEKKYGDKTLVAFATVTLIDPAGNRLHTDDEMAFAQKGPPPQPRMLIVPASQNGPPSQAQTLIVPDPNPSGHFPGQP